MWMLLQDSVPKSQSSSPRGFEGPLLTSCLPVVCQSSKGGEPPGGLGLLALERTSAPQQQAALTPAQPGCDS